MDIKHAKEEIKNTIEAYLLKNAYGEYVIDSVHQRPVLLMGPPGIGKTQIMEQIARECRIGLVAYTITHHTRQSAVGLPFIKEKEYGGRTFSVTEYTMSEIIASIYDCMERTGCAEGILFIDEINCVSETMAPMMLQFLQCKTFGNQKVPEGWIIVAAGNPPEYNRSVREFDVVTLDRVKRINVEPDFDVWKEYAYQERIHGAIISYLDIKRGSFYCIEKTIDGMNIATPRGWEDLSNIMAVYEKLGKSIDANVVIQYIQHPMIAKDFANYLELYRKYYTDYKIDSVLAGSYDTSAVSRLHFAEFDERMSVVGLLISALSVHFAEAFIEDKAVTQVFAVLRSVQQQIGSSSLDADLAERAVLQERARLDNALAADEAAVRLAGADVEAQHRVLAALGAMAECARKNAFDGVREEFYRRTDARQALIDKISRELDNAYDFLEAAFGQGQELVLFTAELAAGYYSAWFIDENGCDRFYMYNKGLLFSQRHREISAEIETAQEMMAGADLKIRQQEV